MRIYTFDYYEHKIEKVNYFEKNYFENIYFFNYYNNYKSI